VMTFDEILRLMTAVFHAFMGEEVDRYSFLTQDIPAVFFIASMPRTLRHSMWSDPSPLGFRSWLTVPRFAGTSIRPSTGVYGAYHFGLVFVNSPILLLSKLIAQ
jgi:hypothetical protein